MSLWLLIPFLLFVAIVQTSLVPLAPVLGLKIDLPLIVIVAQGLVGSAGSAAQWGFIVGLFLDLASGLPFGIHALALTGIGVLMDLGQAIYFRGNLLAPPVAIVSATIVYQVLILAVLSLSTAALPWGDYLLRIVLPTALLNTLAFPFVYFPMHWFSRPRAPIEVA
jgi:rod shape-determining protein MreD